MTPETVLLVHNRYRERGGEDAVVEAEAGLLERAGHRVLTWLRDNHEIAGGGGPGTALRAVWSREDRAAIGALVRRERVDVAHFHNTFPLISPAGLYGARAAGAAVVKTLHNFRLLCVNAQFLRDGRTCELCLGRAVAWPGVVHSCYRGSRGASAVVAATTGLHRAVGTWRTQVDAFIALSRFARDRFIAGGLPPERLHLGAGFVAAPPPPREGQPGTHLLFAGRLSEEKGVRVLLSAWRRLPVEVALRVIGDGPLGPEVAAAAAADPRITWLGAVPRETVLREMAGARALVFPALSYENFPGVLAEAQAAGLPAIASRLGSTAEILDDAGSGVLVEPGDAAALAGAVQALVADPDRRASLAAAARSYYEARLTPERALDRLRAVYASALAHRHGALADPVLSAVQTSTDMP